MPDRALWKRWLLLRTVPARIVLVTVLLCAPRVGWRGWCWWTNTRVVGWADNLGGGVMWVSPSPDDTLAEWRDHPALGTIEVILLRDHRPVAPAEMGRLRWLPGLREIGLLAGQYGDAHLAQLPPLPRLEILSLHGTAFTDGGLERLLPNLPGLKVVWLQDTRVSPAMVETMKAKGITVHY